MIFEVIIATDMNDALFCNVTSCSSTYKYQCFGGIYFFHLQNRRDFYPEDEDGIIKKAGRFSEDLTSIYQTTRRHVSGDSTDNLLLLISESH
jgi:hypothetical protein